jgi:prepilin-type N-terminal cleavage/methylation domain-containing protein
VIARLRDQSGLTLIEVLVAMVISLIVLGATMSVSIALTNQSRRTTDHNDAQDTARTHLDRLARQLRNLASPTLFTEDYQAQPDAIDVAEPYDLVFRVVDEVRPDGSLNAANVKRVRYCLDASDPARGRLYQQEQTWTDRASSDPPPVPSVSSCPGSGWSTTTAVTAQVTNRNGGADRPVFVFNSADPQRISQVHTELYVDPDPTRDPVETRLASGVTLRNQNRAPVANIDASPSGAGRVVLNGSGSEDPESRPLTYQWYVDPPTDLPDCTTTPVPASCLGEGVVIEAELTSGVEHRIVLLVKDPAGLPGTEEKTVTTQ